MNLLERWCPMSSIILTVEEPVIQLTTIRHDDLLSTSSRTPTCSHSSDEKEIFRCAPPYAPRVLSQTQSSTKSIVLPLLHSRVCQSIYKCGDIDLFTMIHNHIKPTEHLGDTKHDKSNAHIIFLPISF